MDLWKQHKDVAILSEASLVLGSIRDKDVIAEYIFVSRKYPCDVGKVML